MMKTKSTRKVTVGTVQKSHDTRCSTWLTKNAFHVGEEGL